VITDNDIQQPAQLLDSVASALTRAGMHDRAGDFYHRLEELQRALDSYIRGSAFRKAVELARRSFPSRVVELQEQWGDYLVSESALSLLLFLNCYSTADLQFDMLLIL
jgi:intraflagellar transport protein 172